MNLNSNIQILLPNTAMGWEVQTPPTPMRRAVTAYANYHSTVANTTKATSNGHGFITGDIITHSGTTNYNGTIAITRIDANNYYFATVYVADDGASIAQKAGVLTLGRADVKVILYTDLKCYYRFVTGLPSNADGALVLTTDLFIADTTEKELYVPHGLVTHGDDPIYLLLLASATGAPTISAVVQ